MPEIERQLWRYQLFIVFRKYPRFQAIVHQDLRPLWRQTFHGADLAHRFARFREHIERVRHPRRFGPPPAELVAYVELVERIVVDTLRLTRDGRPAAWALDFLHAQVEERAGADGLVEPDPNEPLPPSERGKQVSPLSSIHTSLELHANAFGARVTSVVPPVVDKSVPTKGFGHFNQWDALRKEAHDAIDRQVNYLRETYREWYPVERNPTSKEAWLEDCEAFAKSRLEQRPPLYDRDRLRRFAERIGADL